jgi:hypothetical protein
MTKRRSLRNILLKELSLVDHPANQHARVSLFKREAPKPSLLDRLFGRVTKSEEPPQLLDLLGQSLDSIVLADDLTPEGRIALINKSLDEFRDSVIGAVTKGEEDEDDDEELVEEEEAFAKNVPGVNQEPVDSTPNSGAPTSITKDQDMNTPEEIRKGLTPAALAYIESIEKAASEAKEQVEKAAQEAAQRELVAKATALVGETGLQTEPVVALLKQLDAAGQAALGTIVGQLATVTKSAKLTEELGSNDTDAPSISATIEKRAEELRKSDPKLTQAQAITKALVEDPDAYEASLTGDAQ